MDIKLSKKERKVLEYLDSSEGRIQIVGVSADYLAGRIGLPTTTSKDILQKLATLSFIEQRESGYPKKEIKYVITSEGEAYLEIDKELKINRVIWNIIVPILVAFFTSLLTSLIMS